MQPDDLKALLGKFASYITEPGEKTNETLLEICDRIVALHHDTQRRNVPFTFDNETLPDAPREDYTRRRELVSAHFPDYGFYRLPDKIEEFEAEALVGDAVDDIADLLADFEEILWCFDNTSTEDALWHFHNGYWTHWGLHMRNLQLYLFRKITGR